jgi:hypothetical protein
VTKSDEEYFAIKRRAAARLLKMPNVTGVGIGGRERNGQPTGEVVIKVFVAQKKPASEVPAGELIPASFEGVHTDVVEMGPGVPIAAVPGAVAPAAMATDEARTDPMRGGMDIRIDFGLSAGGGTLGCFLRDRRDETAVYGLTNHHVVTKSKARFSRSRTVLQQSQADPAASERIGIVARGADDVARDAAAIRIHRSQEWLPAIKDIGFVTGTHTVTVAEAATGTYQVRKRGAKTRLTGGVVASIGTENLILPDDRGSFDMVIKPNPHPAFPPSQQVFFAFFGDSGSVAVNEDNEVIALLYRIESAAPTSQFVKAIATPIHIVLDRFRKFDRLDLEVAVAGPNPTDASERRTVPPAAGAAILTANDLIAKGDPVHRRPLTGGSQIMAEPMLGALNSATLGCVVTQVANPGTAYILTSFSGVSANGSLPPTSDTDVGQPDNDGSISGCCSNTVGAFSKAGGPPVGPPVAALVKLEDDQQWLAEILEIGLIDGVDTFDALDISMDIAHVRKYGAGTRLTGGKVVALGGVHGTLPAGIAANAMLIRPNPNPSRPGEDICFSHFVDRGAVVVNSNNAVVALLYGEEPVIEPSGQRIVHGVAAPILAVLDQLKTALGGVALTVGKATLVDDVRTTSSRVIADRGKSALPPLRPRVAGPPAAVLAHLQSELSRSATGQLIIARWLEHQREIRHLVDHHRKVATVWHRSGGPALLQAILRALHSPDVVIPTSINGLSIAASLDRLKRILCKYGSPALGADAEHVHSLLPDIGGLSFPEIVASLDRS